MINFDFCWIIKIVCVCVWGWWWVEDVTGVFSTNKIGICYFFADVKLFTVKMAKPAMAACISHVEGAIVNFVSCELFIYNCFQIVGLSSFNLLRFEDSAKGSEKYEWQMFDYLVVI